MPTSVWGSTSPLSGPSGLAAVAAGATSLVLTDPRITPSSVILASIQSADATLSGIRSIVCGSGIATFTFNAAASAPVAIGYVIVNPSVIG